MAYRLGKLPLASLFMLLLLALAAGAANADSHTGSTMGSDDGMEDGGMMGDGALGGKAKTTMLAEQMANNLVGPLVWVAHEADVKEAVTHTHEVGFIYAVDDSHAFTVGGQEIVLEEGQGGWIGASVEHTHSGSGTFWEIRLTAPGAGPPEGLENAEEVFESEILQGLPEAQAALKFILVEVPTGGQTSVHTHPGPEYIYVTGGDIQYQNALIGTEQTEAGEDHTLPANTAVQKRNAEGETAVFLSWFVVDPDKPFAPEASFEGVPEDVPETGAGGLSRPANTVPMVALALLGVMAAGALMVMRGRRA